MRRAVGKKKQEELLKHREKFIQGAGACGIPQDAAERIFADIEYFANYGFNKAHAADYAVITCQTAYLKAHYPVEYMTALLTVERHNVEKVGALISECRAMGIEVLPPDINASDSQFIIDDRESGPAIRFGLGAVKNVGEGAIEFVLRERAQNGAFATIDDFCRRVDLRQVNRRAVESLIRVGALRAFGQRAQTAGDRRPHDVAVQPDSSGGFCWPDEHVRCGRFQRAGNRLNTLSITRGRGDVTARAAELGEGTRRRVRIGAPTCSR